MSIGGSKGKSKTSQSFNQTQTNTLSDRAAGLIGGQIGSLMGQDYKAFDPASMGAFSNPFTADVIDSSLARLNHEGDIARMEQKAEMAKRGAFGNDRRGIYEATLDAEIDRNRGELISGLNAANFQQSLAAALGENQNQNAYNLDIQGLISALVSQVANEGTTRGSGTSQGTTKNSGFGFSWTPKFGGG